MVETTREWRLIGGLAVGLGVGVAVATGMASSASASTGEEPSQRGSVSSSDSPARGGAVARGSVDRGPATAVRRSAPRAIAEPAATVRAAAVVAPASPRASALSSPLASAPRAIFPWNDPRGRRITIYKGTHFAIPNSFGFFIREVVGTGTFTANTIYDLKDEDQFDWNKFTGIAFTPLEPDRDSAMVGWRYNLVSGEFEIAPFYNVDKARILPNERTEVISVPADATFQYRVDYTGVTVTYGTASVFKPYPTGLTPNVWTAARVSGWFGGNEVAPRTVSYYLKIN